MYRHSIHLISTKKITSTTNQALIIGGGPCGAVTALALRQKGIKCQIFDRIGGDISKLNLGAGLTLHGGAMCLKYLGYEKEWLSIRNAVNSVKYQSHDGKLYIKAITKDLESIDNSYLIGSSKRHALHEMLVDICMKEDNIQYHFDKEFIKYTHDHDNNTITAHFKDGTTATGNILIGADGVNSNVRRTMLGDEDNKKCKIFSGFSYYYSAGFLEDVIDNKFDSKEMVFDINDTNQCMIVYQPIEKQKSYVFFLFDKAEVTEDTDWGMSQNAEDMIDKVEKYGFKNDYSDLIKYSEYMNHLSVYVVKLKGIRDSWHDGRAIILGDAAHATSPFGGQGANQSIYDAVQLAHLFGKDEDKELCDYENKEIQDVFKNLYDIRSEIVTKKVEESLFQGHTLVPDGILRKFLRSILFKVIGKHNLREKLLKRLMKPDIDFDLFSK